MEVVYRCCCGIDVHKSLIVACLRTGGKRELREFGTMTWEIKALAHWLTEAGCEMAAMESTGPYWKPLYNLFELLGLDAMIVNAAHMKAVPGRKTDVKDAEWIADLLQHGLLRASFVPAGNSGSCWPRFSTTSAIWTGAFMNWTRWRKRTCWSFSRTSLNSAGCPESASAARRSSLRKSART